MDNNHFAPMFVALGDIDRLRNAGLQVKEYRTVHDAPGPFPPLGFYNALMESLAAAHPGLKPPNAAAQPHVMAYSDGIVVTCAVVEPLVPPKAPPRSRNARPLANNNMAPRALQFH
jgi:hypothetical protein